MVTGRPGGSLLSAHISPHTPAMKLGLPTSIFLLVFSYLPFVRGDLTNVTIDDTYGDIITHEKAAYTPSDGWAQGPCDGCHAQPNPNLTFGGTWHDATHNPEDLDTKAINLTFKGLPIIFLSSNITF